MRHTSQLVITLLFVSLIAGGLSIARAEEETVKIGFGTLKLGGVYQSTFTWYEDDALASQFKLKRARLILSGTLVPDKVTFFVQGDGAATPYILDTRLNLNYIPKTQLSIGRFVPSFTLYMPLSTAKLDFVNYPFTTSKFAMWRQTGMQSTTTLPLVDFSFGVFNGYQTDPGSTTLKGDDWGDNNDAKDFLARVDIKPLKQMKFGLFGWLGQAYDSVEDEDFDVSRFGFNWDWLHTKFHFAAEYVMGSVDYAATDSIDSMAYMVQGSYILNPAWEFLGRYEAFDPNTDSDDDAMDYFTAGFNYSIASINTKFFVNYIFKMEEGDSIDNDELVIQAQFSF